MGKTLLLISEHELCFGVHCFNTTLKFLCWRFDKQQYLLVVSFLWVFDMLLFMYILWSWYIWCVFMLFFLSFCIQILLQLTSNMMNVFKLVWLLTLVYFKQPEFRSNWNFWTYIFVYAISAVYCRLLECRRELCGIDWTIFLYIVLFGSTFNV